MGKAGGNGWNFVWGVIPGGIGTSCDGGLEVCELYTGMLDMNV